MFPWEKHPQLDMKKMFFCMGFGEEISQKECIDRRWDKREECKACFQDFGALRGKGGGRFKKGSKLDLTGLFCTDCGRPAQEFKKFNVKYKRCGYHAQLFRRDGVGTGRIEIPRKRAD